MKLYHASLCHNLHKVGMKINSEPTCGRFKEPYVYLGSLEYLEKQYFRYCPKGIYYVFEVDIDQQKLEYLEKVNHYRYSGNIDAHRINPHSVKVVK